MFILILIFNLIALLFTAVAASSRPSRSNKLTVIVAICAFMLALYQVDSGKFNPFVLAATSLLNLFLIVWLARILRASQQNN
jgi:Ca2+/Na+ antiporter